MGLANAHPVPTVRGRLARISAVVIGAVLVTVMAGSAAVAAPGATSRGWIKPVITTYHTTTNVEHVRECQDGR